MLPIPTSDFFDQVFTPDVDDMISQMLEEASNFLFGFLVFEKEEKLKRFKRKAYSAEGENNHVLRSY